MARIQLITILVNILFLLYISRLIIKGKLREEYSIVWGFSTIILMTFAFWRDGLTIITKLVGIVEPPNLIFTTSIFVILIYLLHLSVVNSKLHKNIARLTQELALLKEKVEKKDANE